MSTRLHYMPEREGPRVRHTHTTVEIVRALVDTSVCPVCEGDGWNERGRVCEVCGGRGTV